MKIELFTVLSCYQVVELQAILNELQVDVPFSFNTLRTSLMMLKA